MRKLLPYKIFEVLSDDNLTYEFSDYINQNTTEDDIKNIRRLLNGPVNINNIPRYGSPLLIKAAIHNNLKLVKLFLEYGADINIQAKRGNTALMVLNNNKETPETLQIAKYLIEHGADMTILNDDKENFITVCNPIIHTLLYDVPEYLKDYDMQKLILSKEPSLYKSFKDIKVQVDHRILEEMPHLRTGNDLNLF